MSVIAKSFSETWRNAFSSRGFRNQFFLTILVFVGASMHNFHCLREWQSREGVLINDVVLNQLQPHNFSAEIFIVEYLTMLLVTFITVQYPDRLVQGLQMFALVIFARTCSIYFFPLDPPRDMIFLNDPLASIFLHTKDTVVTKDLFFSGHVAALTLLMLIVPNKYVKIWTLFATVFVGILIMWQHVHYSLDVVFAPFASFVSYKIILFVHRESRYGLELQEQKAS